MQPGPAQPLEAQARGQLPLASCFQHVTLSPARAPLHLRADAGLPGCVPSPAQRVPYTRGALLPRPLPRRPSPPAFGRPLLLSTLSPLDGRLERGASASMGISAEPCVEWIAPNPSGLGAAKPKEAGQNAYSTRYSPEVTHPSTGRAQPCLASEIRRERALSGWYGR